MADIVQLKKAGPLELQQINALLQQFGDRNTTLALLDAVVSSVDSELWVVMEAETIIGMTTLVTSRKLDGVFSRIEDVVVDENHRGKGLGKALCQRVIDRARELGAIKIQLTSRPERVAANEMYKKLGFELKQTNVYRMKF